MINDAKTPNNSFLEILYLHETFIYKAIKKNKGQLYQRVDEFKLLIYYDIDVDLIKCIKQLYNAINLYNKQNINNIVTFKMLITNGDILFYNNYIYTYFIEYFQLIHNFIQPGIYTTIQIRKYFDKIDFEYFIVKVDTEELKETQSLLYINFD